MPSEKRKMSQSDYKPYKKAKSSSSKADQFVAPSFKRTNTYRRMVNRGFLGAAGEAKYVDTALASYGLNSDSASPVTHIDIVPVGSTVNSRDGRKFKPTSVQLRGIARSDTTTVASNGAVYLVWDRQPNKALASVTDILDSQNSNSFGKRENAQRFRIIKKWRYDFIGNYATAGQQTSKSQYDVDEYVKLPEECLAECTTADTTGAIGNRVTGALLMVTVGDTAGGTTDATFTVRIRTNFRDV